MSSLESSGDELSTLDTDILQKVLPFAQQHYCRKGDDLVDTGDEAQAFYYVESGMFEVSYTSRKTAIVVAIIGPGSILGEIGFFDGMTRTRTILAVEEARVRVFNKQVMTTIQSLDPIVYADFMELLLRCVCRRFRQILSDRGPLTAYAAALSTGKEQFQGLQPLPADLLGSSGWQRVNQQLEQFKAALFDLSYRLQKDPSEEIPTDLMREGGRILDNFQQQVRQYEDGVAAEHTPLMWGYAFKELFPYFMRSRLAEMAYYKPKGYAGDFKMMEWIYRKNPDGDGKLGRLIDGWLLEQVPPEAVRNRRKLLGGLLDRLFRERLGDERQIHVMNLACGPCRELFDLLTQCDYSDRIDALCIDIDAEALHYANRYVNTEPHNASVRFMHENVIKWALGRAKHDMGPQDIIYSSGLCDYLDDRMMQRLIERCYQQLSPGGAFIVGNFTPSNPDRQFMDNIMYWRLIHRNENDMRSLFESSPFGNRVELVAEEHGVNLFAIALK
ncbi:MAG: cyclic nucleotide-binding domain-containing protein [Desulfobacteraceae bacterium]